MIRFRVFPEEAALLLNRLHYISSAPGESGGPGRVGGGRSLSEGARARARLPGSACLSPSRQWRPRPFDPAVVRLTAMSGVDKGGGCFQLHLKNRNLPPGRFWKVLKVLGHQRGGR